MSRVGARWTIRVRRTGACGGHHAERDDYDETSCLQTGCGVKWPAYYGVSPHSSTFKRREEPVMRHDVWLKAASVVVVAALVAALPFACVGCKPKEQVQPEPWPEGK